MEILVGGREGGKAGGAPSPVGMCLLLPAHLAGRPLSLVGAFVQLETAGQSGRLHRQPPKASLFESVRDEGGWVGGWGEQGEEGLLESVTSRSLQPGPCLPLCWPREEEEEGAGESVFLLPWGAGGGSWGGPLSVGPAVEGGDERAGAVCTGGPREEQKVAESLLLRTSASAREATLGHSVGEGPCRGACLLPNDALA